MKDEQKTNEELASELNELRERAGAFEDVISALRESEERFKAFTRDSAYAYFELDLEGRIVSANRRAEHISGYSGEELLALSFRDVLLSKDAERAAADLRSALDSPNAGPREYTMARKDGTPIAVECNAIPLRRGGKVVGFQCTASDITERQRAEDRCPYAVVEAAMRTIVQLAPEIADEDAAWEAFIASRGPEHRAYFEAIRRSRHSMFGYQQQQLYEFGMELTRSDPPEEFCAACGRQFTRMFSFESIRGFLRAALAGRGGLQATIVNLVRDQVRSHAGSRFVISDETTPEGIRLTIESSRPEADGEYYQQHGLDPQRCFRNSCHFIAGAVGKGLSSLPGHDVADAELSISGLKAHLHLPVKGGAGFTPATVVRAISGYVEGLLSRGRKAAEEEEESPESGVVMRAAVMRQTWEKIRRASGTSETILLRGETGTGKSFIAGKVHELSARREGPFIEVGLLADVGSENMIQSNLFGHRKGAFTGAAEDKKGLFSLADGGTIFLDEIGDAGAELQAKLLRVIETSSFKPLGGLEDLEVDVRVIAATNRDLEAMVGEGAFRQDLYYRLNVIPVELPPLRERAEDVPALAEFLLARAAAGGRGPRKRLAAALGADLCAYPWPGNVRELDHALRHAAAMAEGPEITREDLPGPLRAFLERDGDAVAPGAEAPRAGGIIDREALRRAIRSSDPVTAGMSGRPQEIPAHFEHAKRVYLETLIEEFAGDLGLIARFWDRSSEKTILKLIRDCGLEGRLQAARACSKPQPPPAP